MFPLLLTLVMAATDTVPTTTMAESATFLEMKAPETSQPNTFSLNTNIIPWIATIPNVGGSFSFDRHWSVNLDLWYCPWIITSKYSLKCGFILPEVRWWPDTNRKGHFFNVHLSFGWYNLRFGSYRYQDAHRPLLGAGIGYGYLLELGRNWGIEFSVGAGFVNTKYDRFYNIRNGAVADTRVTNYFGIDRLGISFVYRIADL